MMPSGSEAVVMLGGFRTCSGKSIEALCGGVEESVTVTRTVKLPELEGVPESTPVVEFRVIWAGWPVAVMVYGDRPPCAENVVEGNGCPTIPRGSVSELIVGAVVAAVMLMVLDG